MTRKKALLLCAGHNDLGLIFNLRKLGYYIIATGRIPGLCGEKYVDRYVNMDYSDQDAVLQLAGEEKIDVILPCCNDFGVYTAAYVAGKMNLPGHDSYEVTLTLHNKDKFKKFAEKQGLSVVPSFDFTSVDDACRWCENAELPLIVKPVDASAGNGISKILSAGEIVPAINKAFASSKSGRIVVERAISGTQHGFCTFLKDQKVVAFCSNNEYSFANPFRVEIDTWPADNENEIKEFLIAQIEKIAGILELKDGIFHLQCIVENGKPYIIEVMRRILGNMYSIPAQMVSGFDWDYFETKAKCGLPDTVLPAGLASGGFFAYKTVLARENGVIESIEIPERLERYIWDSFFVRKENDEITHWASEPVGFLFMQFSSQEEMKKVLIDDYSNDFVVLKPEKIK